ncbi:MAG: carbohydrate-binding family 9-like protein [archaeon]
MKKHVILYLFLNSILAAQGVRIPPIKFAPPVYICYHAGSAINIDGRLNEASWLKAPWTENFVDIKGSSGSTPWYRTRAKMLWDDNNLYVAAELQEINISATMKEHDTPLYLNNNFEIFIDPDGDTHNYAEIELNALNTTWDLLLLKPYRDIKLASLSSWEVKGLKTAVSLNGTLNNPSDEDSSWVIEAAIPLKTFKELANSNFPPKDGNQWRVNFSRVEWGTEENQGQNESSANSPGKEVYWVWAPQGLINMHYPEMWGYVQFSADTAGSQAAEFRKNKSETAKWFLRQVYYKERNYFSKNGKYTADLKKLGIEALDLPGYVSKPVIECTNNLFEAYIESADHLQKVHIRYDGLIWVSDIQNAGE